jgi:probable F420-dependent oxidoreductase
MWENLLFSGRTKMTERIRFDIELPNAREGVYVPIGFGSPGIITNIAVEAERLGFDALWVNDFITPTPDYRIPDSGAPNWYEPIVTLAYCAALTKKIELGTGVLMTPFRDPAVVAKEIATLDQLSNGRVLLGLGIGAFRDEYNVLRPRQRKMVRGKQLDEFIESIKLLLADTPQAASYQGEYIEFGAIRLDPKPVRAPIPIYVPGRALEALERAARFGVGIMVRAGSVVSQVQKLRPLAEAHGRDPESIGVIAEIELRLAPTREKAIDQYRTSRLGKLRTEIRDMKLDQLVTDNWIGSPSEVCDKIGALVRQGIKHFSALNIAADTVEERMEQMEMLAREVTCHFRA